MKIHYQIYNSFDETPGIFQLFERLNRENIVNIFNHFFWIKTYSDFFCKDKLKVIAGYGEQLEHISVFQMHNDTFTTLCDHKTDYNCIFIGYNFDFSNLIEYVKSLNIKRIYFKNIIKEHHQYVPADVHIEKIICPYLILKEELQLEKKLQMEIGNKSKSFLKKEHELSLTIIPANELNTDDFLSLHRSWWNAKSQTGLFLLETEQLFLKTIISNFATIGKMHYSVLNVGTDIGSAMLLIEIFPDRIGYYFGGHNIKYKNRSIGNTHILELLNYLKCISKYKVFDFLRGDERYKHRFGAISDNFVFNFSIYLN